MRHLLIVVATALAVGVPLPGCATKPSPSSPPDAQAAAPSPPETAEALASPPALALDPLEQWRLEDARDAQLHPDGAAVSADALKPGLVEARGSAPVDRILAAFGVRAKAVSTCARGVRDAPHLLRARVVIDPQGHATWVATDYGVTLPDAARRCVESVLRTRPYALATGEGLTVTYRFVFDTFGL
jgi:hypothetical protein